MSRKLVAGQGVYEKGIYPVMVGDKLALNYRLWCGMLNRCYSERYHKKQPTYIGCSVSEEFKYFQQFAEWCDTQTGFGNKGWQLDKDIICRGNKQYNSESCSFIPRQINSLLLDCGAVRGLYPVGVSLNSGNGKLQVHIRKKGKSYHLGFYDLVEDAAEAYREAKELYVKEIAKEYKSQINVRVYEALVDWKVDINLTNRGE